MSAVIVVRTSRVTANERVQMERKLAALRPAWDALATTSVSSPPSSSAAEHTADPSGPCAGGWLAVAV